MAKQDSRYSRARAEVQEKATSNVDPQSLPYLNGVVREDLRLSMANRVSFPRVVPPKGLSFQGYEIPSGTNVGVASRELHFISGSFPEPIKFRPERWLHATPEMHRDWVPFGKGARGCIARNLALTELVHCDRAHSGLEHSARSKDQHFGGRCCRILQCQVWGREGRGVPAAGGYLVFSRDGSNTSLPRR